MKKNNTKWRPPPSHHTSPHSQKQNFSFRNSLPASISWKVWLAAGVVAYLGTSVASYSYLKAKKKKHEENARTAEVTDEERARTFDRVASRYDRELGLDEWLTGIILYRRRLLAHAQYVHAAAYSITPNCFHPPLIVDWAEGRCLK